MNSFEIMGQAHLDVAEGQRLMAIATMQWLRKTGVKLIDAVGRYLPESKTAPW